MMDQIHLKTRLRGVFTAMITPFKAGEIDYHAFENLIEWQIQSGIHGIVICGTTGEVPTLTCEERERLIQIGVRRCSGRVPLIVGTGTNDTRETICITEQASRLGADAALVVLPYYNKPSQEGICRHFEVLSESVGIPIIVYNVPQRTGVDLSLPILHRLSRIRNIIGLKDASGDVSRVFGSANILGDDFIQMSGHDPTTLDFYLSGGHGAISVISNVFPHLVVKMHDSFMRGDIQRARYIRFQLSRLLGALELEPNPAPIKRAMKLQYGLADDMRLPLVPVSRETSGAIQQALTHLAEQSPDTIDAAPGLYRAAGGRV